MHQGFCAADGFRFLVQVGLRLTHHGHATVIKTEPGIDNLHMNGMPFGEQGPEFGKTSIIGDESFLVLFQPLPDRRGHIVEIAQPQFVFSLGLPQPAGGLVGKDKAIVVDIKHPDRRFQSSVQGESAAGGNVCLRRRPGAIGSNRRSRSARLIHTHLMKVSGQLAEGFARIAQGAPPNTNRLLRQLY